MVKLTGKDVWDKKRAQEFHELPDHEQQTYEGYALVYNMANEKEDND